MSLKPKNWGICYDCGKRRKLTHHHETKNGKRTGTVFCVCRDCHDIREIEEGIRQKRRRRVTVFMGRLTINQRTRYLTSIREVYLLTCHLPK